MKLGKLIVAQMGNEDIGRHFEQTGALEEAAEAFGRMRHDASTLKHIMDCTRRLVEVAIQRREWNSVVSHANKAVAMRDHEEEKHMRPYLHLVLGIGQLGLGKFQEAAEAFLTIDPTEPMDWIASPADIATYGGLLALATMDRGLLQARTIDNPSFRYYLEHEPQIRKSISLFVNGRYSLCLESLEPLRPDVLLDIHMQRHVDTIFRMIRRKCIVQYFVPFSCVTIKTLEAEFSAQGKSMDDELVEMIQDDQLNARVDAKDRVCSASDTFRLEYVQLTKSRSFWSPWKRIPARHFRRTHSTLRIGTKKRPRSASDASTSLWLVLRPALPRSMTQPTNGTTW